MIWMAIVRAGTVMSMVAAVTHYYDQRNREVKPTRIYTSTEAARLLGVDRRSIIKLIKSEQLRGRLVKGNFRIPGQSLIEYINQ
jgi:excisionase family DNA binding protein